MQPQSIHTKKEAPKGLTSNQAKAITWLWLISSLKATGASVQGTYPEVPIRVDRESGCHFHRSRSQMELNCHAEACKG